MKENIHPKYHKATATCACGETYQIGSTKENIRVDICSACHPLFTGKQKLLDSEGRVKKFEKKYAGAKKAPSSKKKKIVRRLKKKTPK
jgi:large subunit ribosomal protein L31